MSYIGIFVEDNDTEAGFAEQMSTKGKLQIKHERPQPVSKHSKAIFSANPDLLVLDFRLDLDLGDMDASEAYKGSAMAQQIRDQAINDPRHDFPIVLVSSEEKIRDQFEPDRTSHDLFDKVYAKEEVNSNRDKVRREVISLCKGYKVLRSKVGAFNLLDLAGLSSEQDYVLDYQELQLSLSRAVAPHLISATFLNLLIGRTGLLLDINEACARLGVSSSEGNNIAAILDEHGLKYKGIFSDGWSRFWAHSLDEFAYDIFKSRATGIPADDRATELSKYCGKKLQPALSPWTGKTDELIAFSCACCSNGTEMRHSVGVFEMGLPSFAVRRRICWRCIHEDRYLDTQPPFMIDDSDKSLVEEIKKREVPE
ncbi:MULTISPECIES: hypothetical protein [Halomonadaceae]|uniref:hypothetical protein n=1 Tax=Halomonadaceae TaxID=28256 RepID=UPI0012F05A6E|nr:MULTISPECIES: hypothetical protein [Halomonas]CAD5263654.1 conserved hypothetical protein [Halomonas sp. 113]CAD5265703.1 conserved hypothetical protein [Halomonas sp. 59]CAD5278458.1 conserved hypothetical protein [Halomonas sp. I3]CAD5284511.1 conserved hypothetical protein [Halomonas sp. 156]VXB55355.1 conserved hypothetical protein [Halomonas titanicae]